LLKAVTSKGVDDSVVDIQSLVSHYNINNNKSECRIAMHAHEGENVVLRADVEKPMQNMTANATQQFVPLSGSPADRKAAEEARRRAEAMAKAHYLNDIKDECFEALESLSSKINTNDGDIRSHVVLSMIKVSAVLADVPPRPSGAAASAHRDPSGGLAAARRPPGLAAFGAAVALLLARRWP